MRRRLLSVLAPFDSAGYHIRSQFTVGRYRGPGASAGRHQNKKRVVSATFGGSHAASSAGDEASRAAATVRGLHRVTEDPSAGAMPPDHTDADLGVEYTGSSGWQHAATHSEEELIDENAPGPMPEDAEESDRVAMAKDRFVDRSASISVVDKFGMKAEHESAESLSSLSSIFHDSLVYSLNEFCASQRIEDLSALQKVVIPMIMERRDVNIVAPTGTGKTLAFVLPALAQLLSPGSGSGSGLGAAEAKVMAMQATVEKRIKEGQICKYCELELGKVKVCPVTGKLHPPPREMEGASTKTLLGITSPRVLILAPTTLLVNQTAKVAESLRCGLKVSAVGKTHSREERHQQLQAYEQCDVLVSTPEQILQLVYRRKLSLKQVETLVMDETDVLLGIEFWDAVKNILSKLEKGPLRPQRILVSATFPKEIQTVVTEKLLLPTHRTVTARLALSSDGTAESNLTHQVFLTSHKEKVGKLLSAFDNIIVPNGGRTIIFCKAQATVAFVCDKISRHMRDVHDRRLVPLYSKSDNEAKQGAQGMFQRLPGSILVTTDVCSRGLDFDRVVNCVHFDVPPSIEVWEHRNGRAGRRGQAGNTFTLFQPEDMRLAKPIVAKLRQQRQPVPRRLQEYAKQSFIDLLTTSRIHSTTRTKRKATQESHHAVIPNDRKFPDFKQDRVNRAARPFS